MSEQKVPETSKKKPVIERLVVGPYATNCYIVTCPITGATAIIDPAADQDLILKAIAGDKPQMILLTHGHLDHIGAVRPLKNRLGIPLYMHPLDAGLALLVPDVVLEDEQTLELGSLRLRVMSTPGHTPGSVTILVGTDAFVGDLIFPGGPGVTRTPLDFDRILKSIAAKILPLPPETILNPGHGDSFSVAAARLEVTDFLRRPATPNLCGHVQWATA